MELTPRQKQILRAIVDIYVSTAEPVGSKAIAALPDVSFSSATIRNEMAELTQMGFWSSPTPPQEGSPLRQAIGSLLMS